MKNIHLIPIDKLSRLVKIKDNLFYTTTENIPGGVYQNIYITSNEEIKEGDYRMNIQRAYFKEADKEGLEYYNKRNDVFKKIILSTDLTLIADGVQAIDDEFLQWFAENLSCEWVDLNKYKQRGDTSGKWYYKTIIPQEEPKQYPIGGYASGFYSCKCVTCKKEFTGDERAVQCEPCAISTTKGQKQHLIDMMQADEELGLYNEQ